jgi:LPS sulfotransferase NodH
MFSTGLLGSPLEYLHPGHLEKWKMKYEVPDFEGVMTNLFKNRTSPTGWFGVKAHWTQFEPITNTQSHLPVIDFSKFIRIFRSDSIAQAISLVIARKTSAWISFHQVQKQPKYEFRAIQAALAEIEEQNAKWNTFFSKNEIQPLMIEYEALSAMPEVALGNILSYFNLKLESRKSGPVPERQSTGLNSIWKQQYLEDLEAASKSRRWY